MLIVHYDYPKVEMLKMDLQSVKQGDKFDDGDPPRVDISGFISGYIDNFSIFLEKDAEENCIDLDLIFWLSKAFTENVTLHIFKDSCRVNDGEDIPLYREEPKERHYGIRKT